jgi:hypothetical protein
MLLLFFVETLKKRAAVPSRSSRSVFGKTSAPCLFVAFFLSVSAKNTLFFGWQIICLLAEARNSSTFAVSLTLIAFSTFLYRGEFEFCGKIKGFKVAGFQGFKVSTTVKPCNLETLKP